MDHTVLKFCFHSFYLKRSTTTTKKKERERGKNKQPLLKGTSAHCLQGTAGRGFALSTLPSAPRPACHGPLQVLLDLLSSVYILSVTGSSVFSDAPGSETPSPGEDRASCTGPSREVSRPAAWRLLVGPSPDSAAWHPRHGSRAQRAEDRPCRRVPSRTGHLPNRPGMARTSGCFPLMFSGSHPFRVLNSPRK